MCVIVLPSIPPPPLAPPRATVLEPLALTECSRRTNITEPTRKYASSRGDLTAAFLLPKAGPGATLQADIDAILAENSNRAYAGFNMLLLSPSPASGPGSVVFDGAILTNSGGGGTITARALSPTERRCGGLSNGPADDPDPGEDEWPKVQRGRAMFAHDVLDAPPPDAAEAELVERLFALLT